MRILLTNFGTIGDLQPLLALAAELQRHGHAPLVAHSPGYRAQVEAIGVPFAPIGPDLRTTQQAINLAWTTEQDAPYSPTRMRALLGELVAVLPRVYADLAEAAADVDVICAGPAQPAARMAADTRNLPFVSLQVSHFGGIGSPALRLASAALINPVRERLGLMPLRDPLTLDANSSELALYAMSPHVMPTPRSWPRHWHMTGFFFPPDPPRVPDASIVRAVEEGAPPVVITFGSIDFFHQCLFLTHRSYIT